MKVPLSLFYRLLHPPVYRFVVHRIALGRDDPLKRRQGDGLPRISGFPIRARGLYRSAA